MQRAPALLLSLALCANAGCVGAQRVSGLRQRIAAATSGLDDDPAVQAAAARAEAALATESGVSFVEGLEIRSRGISPENVEQGEGVELSARLEMESPWEVAAEHAARRAGTDVAAAELESTALRRRSEICQESADAAALVERREAYDAYSGRIRATLAWNADRRASRAVDDLEAARVELEGLRRLARREPDPLVPSRSAPGSLPAVDVRDAPLVVDQDTIADLIQRNHPAIEEHRAAAQRYESLATRASRRIIPWLTFLEVGYELAEGNTPERISAQVALQVPFGIDQRAESESYGALARSEQLEAEAATNEQVRDAQASLVLVARFEERAADLRALLERAESAEATALGWLEARAGDPSEVAGLLDEALAARDQVTEARHRAATAECVLLETTGVAAARWPRAASPQRGREERGGRATPSSTPENGGDHAIAIR